MYKFFTLTARDSTIPSNIRGCQFGEWSAGQGKIIGTSTKLQQVLTLFPLTEGCSEDAFRFFFKKSIKTKAKQNDKKEGKEGK